MEQQNNGPGYVDDSEKGGKRGFSLPQLTSFVPMPVSKQPEQEKEDRYTLKEKPGSRTTDKKIMVEERKEKMMSYYSSRNAFFKESEYVGQVSESVHLISNISDAQRLHKAGQELKAIIRKALDDDTVRRDLITMEELCAQGMALCSFADERSGGDRLITQRKLILQEAYDDIEAAL